MRGRTPGARNTEIWNDRGEKRCSNCRKFKLPSEYYRTRGYVDSRCKACHSGEMSTRRVMVKLEAAVVEAEIEEQPIIANRLGPPPTGLAPMCEEHERFDVMAKTWRLFTGGKYDSHRER
jgi:hypothetical protein